MTRRSPNSAFSCLPVHFLIAKRKIRNSANPRLFATLHFSNREKTPFRCLGLGRPLLASVPPRILASLIFTLKIRNRRNRPVINHLHFSNLYAPPAFSLAPCGICLTADPPLASRDASHESEGLIYGSGIKNRRNSLKTKARRNA